MHDLLIQIVFYVFAALALLSTLLAITQNNPVRCVLFLVFTFFTAAVLWLLQGAEFLALILILVYVGAVMTLFLFVVMMLNIDVESMRTHFIRYLPFGLIIVALLTGLLLVAVPEGWYKPSVIQQSAFALAEQAEELSNTEKIGRVLYTQYVYAFELAAAILLVAIISAITLVHRGAVRSKRQNIVRQLMTRKEDRIKLVSMKSEQREENQ
jgi:NADH-quinone oxidoreductase subunit J